MEKQKKVLEILAQNIQEFKSRYPENGLEFLDDPAWLEKAVLEPKHLLLKNNFRCIDICQNCHELDGEFLGTEKCPSFMLVFNKSRSIASKSIVFDHTKCTFIKEQEARNERLRISKGSGIPEELEQRATFETFNVNDIEPEPARKQAKDALETCIRYVEGYRKFKEKGFGLYLYGPPLTGKTHLALATCKAVADSYREPVRYISASRLVSTYRKLVRDSRIDAGLDDNAFGYILDNFVDFDGLLLIDDLGSESQTDASVNLISTIVSNRCEYSRPVIITSYFRLLKTDGSDEFVLEDRYGLWGAVGASIPSKIARTCARIPLTKVRPYMKKVVI